VSEAPVATLSSVTRPTQAKKTREPGWMEEGRAGERAVNGALVHELASIKAAKSRTRGDIPPNRTVDGARGFPGFSWACGRFPNDALMVVVHPSARWSGSCLTLVTVAFVTNRHWREKRQQAYLASGAEAGYLAPMARRYACTLVLLAALASCTSSASLSPSDKATVQYARYYFHRAYGHGGLRSVGPSCNCVLLDPELPCEAHRSHREGKRRVEPSRILRATKDGVLRPGS
jgi:hypothetical protein